MKRTAKRRPAKARRNGKRPRDPIGEQADAGLRPWQEAERMAALNKAARAFQPPTVTRAELEAKVTPRPPLLQGLVPRICRKNAERMALEHMNNAAYHAWLVGEDGPDADRLREEWQRVSERRRVAGIEYERLHQEHREFDKMARGLGLSGETAKQKARAILRELGLREPQGYERILLHPNVGELEQSPRPLPAPEPPPPLTAAQINRAAAQRLCDKLTGGLP